MALLTLAYSLLCVHLGAILHFMDGEVNLWDLLFLPHGSDGIVEVLLLVRSAAVHVGQLCNMEVQQLKKDDRLRLAYV